MQKIKKIFVSLTDLSGFPVYNTSTIQTNVRMFADKLGDLVEYKKILRFYFRAEVLNKALDNCILKQELNSRTSTQSAEIYMNRILALTETKVRLSRLWSFLDDNLAHFNEEEITWLVRYSLNRRGDLVFPADDKKVIRRVMMKFRRMTEVGLQRYPKALQLLEEYYCFC